MCRKDLLNEISDTLQEMGFIASNTRAHFTYQSNIKYPSIFSEKNNYAHYILYTPIRTIQIVAKYQQSTGTAMEKLGYTVLDAARTEFDDYLVICGGGELLKGSCAIDFLNKQKKIAPRLHALRVQDLPDLIKDDLDRNAA
ncbi:PD-(D/E)XK nuclease superfamily protein [Vibrio sp. 10N.222.51.E8]|uniref:PD-(D/E)XK nuclease superfamily protein n=1 Tax=unclassified Vibrio TaxID=2614977 RepID=UPI000C84F4F8|nr:MULTISPECIES: PD-(D/E)XK nuclease superfamily protein [unclassified Vibrio]PML67110.1 hypothetical protein BCT71_19510 [Vibrio sp. 10N.261.51.A7]TKG35029.1 hypothetical protein FCV85_05480 [Vibrio sp. F13]